MMGRGMPGRDQPEETRFFMIIAGWALVLGIIYWAVSSEVAGTALLGGLALATGAMAAWLVRGRRRGAIEQHRESAAGADRPFHDEEGRLPDPTLAPFAVGLGIALAATGPVFGVAPVAVGVIALAWGAWTWLAAARDEHTAMTGEE